VAVTIPQHKLISDVAAAQEVLATRQRLGDDVIGHAHAIKTEALAGLGDLLKRMPKSGGGRRPKGSRGSKGRISGTKSEPLMGSPSTLAELGIDKKTSSLAQRLAALSGTERNAVAARDKTLAQVTREKVAKVRAKRLALPDAKFRVVYADPPWQYRDKADAGSVQSGGAARQYPTMSIVELCDLGVSRACEPDAVLFLWVTSPLLFECAPVIKAWGFTYRASIVWDKAAHNMGHYVSVQHEFLLICVRGSCVPDIPKRLASVVTEKRARHSEKPERFRRMIDEMYPKGKRLELFARARPPGRWEAWGNEVD
jgi:N6-adenosine-specific RNA methylase IME4